MLDVAREDPLVRFIVKIVLNGLFEVLMNESSTRKTVTIGNIVNLTWNTVYEDLGLDCLSPIVQGTTQSTRIGRAISLLGITICLCVAPNTTFSTNLGNGQTVRFILVEDKQTNGTTITPTNVFSSVGCMAQRNQLFLSRYTVHDVQTVFLSPDLKNPMHLTFQKNYPKGKTINFSLNNGNVGDLMKTNFYLLGTSTNVFTAVTDMRYGYTVQVRYVDM